jgi:hypothetical protein
MGSGAGEAPAIRYQRSGAYSFEIPPSTLAPALATWQLAYFDWESKDYADIPVDEQVEIASLNGRITRSEGDEGEPPPPRPLRARSWRRLQGCSLPPPCHLGTGASKLVTTPASPTKWGR